MRSSQILASLIALAACPVVLATNPFPKEADLLKDVKVPQAPGKDGMPEPMFDVTLFSAPPQSNYPVFVTATPDGIVYVSSDGNGSLDRNPHRGRILRLRDTDGDGRADEVKEFVKDVDAPRGIVVDGNTVYCVHPPHLSAFIDKDGDGVADEEKILVKNIAFTFKDRPADHTTNGIELGVDGWLYIADGDFGYMEAEGTDGRKVQFRGGGVTRVRPDGTGLQIYARGTRNILEPAVSPLMDIFARDNTNDGGGWDVRFHHFTGFEDHGYPRLFKNFGDEHILPLADYGGGSGTGACWIDEPGWPAAWNNLPYTSDWGTGHVYRHTVKPQGATFVEEGKPTGLVGVTRPTDVDVDAQGYAYVSSWKGATFTWAGPEVGYLVRVAPKGMTPAKVPDFAKASDAELVKLLESPSHRTCLEAQRTLIRRQVKGAALEAVYALAKNPRAALPARVAAVFAFKQVVGAQAAPGLTALAGDPTIAPWVLRALTDREDQEANVNPAVLFAGLKSPDARTRKEAVIGLGRFHGLTGVWADGDTPKPQTIREQGLPQTESALVPLLADSDPIISQTVMQVLRQLKASGPCLAVLDDAGASTPLRAGALMVLRGIHDGATVNGLITRLERTKDATAREGLLTALCRLYFIEGKWKGDSWGTRPDTRGPYYQPEEWAETSKIATVLKNALQSSSNDEAAFLAKEFSRHRIKLDDATSRLISLAAHDASLMPIVAKQLASAETVPAAAQALLEKAAADPNADNETVVAAVTALAKTDGPASAHAILAGLANLDNGKRKNRDLNKARDAFLNSRLLENQHQLFEAEAAKMSGAASVWADAALLRLAGRKIGAPEPRETSAKALDTGWAEPKRREQIIHAAMASDDKSRAAQIVAAMSDSDAAVARLAKQAVKDLKIDPAKVAAAAAPAGPLIATMKVDDVVNQVMSTHGDVARGEQLFTQQGCVACHTVKASEPPKGPFLGNIATIYKRRELAENILMPSKTIAQGFVTNVFTMKDGSVQMGFVTSEAADKVTIRNVAAQEITIDPKDVVKREKGEKSLMPEGLVAGLAVKDFASLLDYLEALAKKQ